MPVYVAIGDSFTEGLQDHLHDHGRHVGWADRVAAGLVAHDDQWTYANLAVRGRLLAQVVDDQLPAALELSPDLVSFHAGPNDVLRPGLDLAWVNRTYQDAVGQLRAGGAEVVLFTVPGRGPRGRRVMARLEERFDGFNDAVRAAADRHGAILVDAAAVEALRDPRLWDEDRLHLSPEGHQRAAAAVLARLGLGQPDVGGSQHWWEQPLPPVAGTTRWGRAAEELRWIRRHLTPWVWRRVRGVSSGDELAAKYPEPISPSWPLP